MTDTPSLMSRFGFRKASGVSEAGWGQTLFVGIISFIYFLPVLLIIITSFKLQTEALAIPPKFFPTTVFGLIPENLTFTPTLENYTSVFSRAMTTGAVAESTGFDKYFFNSILLATVSVALALTIGTLAAFGFSRYPLKGNDTYLFIILTTRMLPAIVVIIPIILMFRVTGLSGSYIGIILLYTAFNLPFTIWMMKSFFDELSLDVEDAARIDGSSELKVFFKICLPQVLAGLAATFVFGLILTWNEFLFALLLTGVDTRTVPVGMSQAVAGGGIGVLWGLLAAIETLFLIPVFLVTFFLQDHLLRGVTFGTVKR
jgi:multiple sugar transport system permease protein